MFYCTEIFILILGELTHKGYNKELYTIWNKYRDKVKEIKPENKQKDNVRPQVLNDNKYQTKHNKSNNGAKKQMKVTPKEKEQNVLNDRKMSSKPSSQTFQKYLRRKIHWSDSDTEKSRYMENIMKDKENIKGTVEKELLEDYKGFLPWEKKLKYSKVKYIFFKRRNFQFFFQTE